MNHLNCIILRNSASCNLLSALQFIWLIISSRAMSLSEAKTGRALLRSSLESPDLFYLLISLKIVVRLALVHRSFLSIKATMNSRWSKDPSLFLSSLKTKSVISFMSSASISALAIFWRPSLSYWRLIFEVFDTSNDMNSVWRLLICSWLPKNRAILESTAN